MLLRVLDAFDEDTKHAQQYSAIAAPWAAAISAAFARSKGAGAGKGGLQAAGTGVGIELRLPGKSLADAELIVQTPEVRVGYDTANGLNST